MTLVRFYDCAKCAAIKQAWCEDKGIAFLSDECPVRVRDARIASLEAEIEAERGRADMMKARNEHLLAVLLTEFGYPDDDGTCVPEFAAKVLHEQRVALAAARGGHRPTGVLPADLIPPRAGTAAIGPAARLSAPSPASSLERSRPMCDVREQGLALARAEKRGYRKALNDFAKYLDCECDDYVGDNFFRKNALPDFLIEALKAGKVPGTVLGTRAGQEPDKK